MKVVLQGRLLNSWISYSEISIKHLILPKLSNACPDDYRICNGSRDVLLGYIGFGIHRYEDVWSSSLLTNKNPIDYRPRGHYLALFGSHSIITASPDVWYQHPAL